MVPLDKLAQITQRFEYLEAKLSTGVAPAEIAQLSREYAELKPVAAEIAAYRRALSDLDEAEAMLAEPEMRALAEEVGFSKAVKQSYRQCLDDEVALMDSEVWRRESLYVDLVK